MTDLQAKIQILGIVRKIEARIECLLNSTYLDKHSILERDEELDRLRVAHVSAMRSVVYLAEQELDALASKGAA